MVSGQPEFPDLGGTPVALGDTVKGGQQGGVYFADAYKVATPDGIRLLNEAAVAHLRPDTLRYMGTSEGVSAFLARGADGDECFVMAYDARSSQVTCGEVASSREPVILIGGNVPSDTVWGSALLPDGYSQATADGKALPVTGRVAFLRLTPIPKSIVIDASGEGKPTIKIPIDMRASSD